MNLSRREFLQLLTAASTAGFSLPGCGQETPPAAAKKAPANPYEVPSFGNVSLLHFTDCHAQLLPLYFREPSINIGVAEARGRPPHLVGENLLKHYGIKPGSREAHAFTYLDFAEAARKYGKVGGFAHLATLVKHLRQQRPGRSLLLDSGDTWQGSATALWTKGQDMVDACKMLGVDIMTGHWEFTYGKERVKELVNGGLDPIEFVAQNVVDMDFEERIFKPYTMRNLKGIPVAVIGQAFPYTPIANPRYMVEGWSFGIRDEALQQVVDEARGEGAQVVVVLSHNGMDVDIKMASRVSGVDVILGGHTHDGMPRPLEVKNRGGKTLVVNSGSNGKFLSVMDLKVSGGKVTDYRFTMLPVFSNLIEADPKMRLHIDAVRAPYGPKLEEKLAVTDTALYRRGNFNGTFDQLILDAMMAVRDAEIAFSPGFRWGASLLPGDAITMDTLMTQTAITYSKSTLSQLSGETIKIILEDVADNLFHEDPYYQQGGDMVRVGGLKYAIDPTKKHGQRISDMQLNGQPLNASTTYSVAGWASVQEQPDHLPEIWDVVAEYLRNQKTVNPEVNMPKIKGVTGNPGLAL
ncbi:MAG: thiosulfohydrolase SoxB [Gammaproteobacteria bacterium]|nr:thiosulfohydrolase SoxB [Gammaproteobacteria bacterium]